MAKLDNRRSRKRESLTTLGESEGFKALKDRLTTADRLPAPLTPPEPELEPLHRKAVGDILQRGPRKRDGEPAASYASETVRVTKDGHMWQVEVQRDLTAEEYARLQASGFDPVDDQARVWNASQKTLAAQGTDINIVAIALDRKAERLGWGR